MCGFKELSGDFVENELQCGKGRSRQTCHESVSKVHEEDGI